MNNFSKILKKNKNKLLKAVAKNKMMKMIILMKLTWIKKKRNLIKKILMMISVEL